MRSAETEVHDGSIATAGVTQIEARDYAESPPDVELQAPVLTDTKRLPPLNEDAKLEARLHLLERTLTEIETRLKQADASSARATSLSEHGAAALFQRMETFERQQVAAVKSLIVDLGAERRESESIAVTSEAAGELSDVSESAGRDSQSAPAEEQCIPPLQQHPSAMHIEVSNYPLEKDEYLAAAQRAAHAAAALVSLDGRDVAADSRWEAFTNTRVRLQRHHYVFAVCGVLVAFLVGGAVAFYAGQARGREMIAQLGTEHRAAQLKPVLAPDSIGADPRTSLAALAQAGDAHAQLLLGLNYLRGNGIALNPSKAVEWVRKAAQQHEPIAQYWLGTLYEHGDGISPDSAEAIRWYEAAAAQGNRKAMHALGVAFAQGHGAPQNYATAAAWFAKAAELGLVNSEFNLGVLYERGLGVPQSLREAYRWYAIAAVRGDEESHLRIEALKTQLTAQDIAIAQNAAATFQPQSLVEAANSLPDIENLPGDDRKPR
jgi:TPR repeat protein